MVNCAQIIIADFSVFFWGKSHFLQHFIFIFVNGNVLKSGDKNLFSLVGYNTATSPAWQNLDAYKGFWGALRDSGCSLIVCGVNSTINEKSVVEFKGATCDNPMYERIHKEAPKRLAL